MDSAAKELWKRARTTDARSVLAGAMGLLRGTLFLVACRLTFKRVKGGRWLRVHGPVHVKGSGTVRIGTGCVFVGDVTKPVCLSTQVPSARIEIGNRVGLNGATIQCAQSIRIGDDSAIAAFYVTDSQNHSLSVARREKSDSPVETAPVTIGRNVWISVVTTVLHGVTIGDNTVVGAHSLVTKDIPPNSFAYGVPAKVVRKLE